MNHTCMHFSRGFYTYRDKIEKNCFNIKLFERQTYLRTCYASIIDCMSMTKTITRD